MSAIDLSDFLRERAKKLQLSAYTISQKAGISRQTWYRLVNANVKKTRLETLERVANVLQVSLIELSHLYTKQKKLQQEALVTILHIGDSYPFINIIHTAENTLVNKGERFEKKWKITNTGKSHWINRCLICVDEDINLRLKKDNQHLYGVKNRHGLCAKHYKINIPLTAPNEEVTLSMIFDAPIEAGTMISFWKMMNATGIACFPDDIGLSCQVSVVGNSVDFADISLDE